jgi:hypothetical protein
MKKHWGLDLSKSSSKLIFLGLPVLLYMLWIIVLCVLMLFTTADSIKYLIPMGVILVVIIWNIIRLVIYEYNHTGERLDRKIRNTR